MSVARTSFAFGPFRLDGVAERLERGREEIELPPRPFTLLRYFLERPGRLVLKEEILEALWPGTYVSEGVLKTHVNEVRRALGDDAREPRYLATVHRRGYRFICDVLVEPESETTPAALTAPEPAPRSPDETIEPAGAPAFVGRAEEITRLGGALEHVLAGRRRFLFIAGEAGIGKTSLVDFFLTTRVGPLELAVGHGQCLEGAGPGEPYGPVLEALGGLARGHRAAQIVPLLRRYAPSWVAQLPWLVAETERSAIAQELLGATRERMLREIAEALEAIAAVVPVVLALEDLQWSDPATLDLCSTLARRREAARLLVLATYRPAEAILGAATLRRLRGELVSRGHASEVLLELLDPEAVLAYLEVRLAPERPAVSLATSLCDQTDGNALFLRTVVDDLIAREALCTGPGGVSLCEGVELAVPESLREMIEGQIERLPAEVQRWLEAGSLVGPSFEAMAVAHATDADPDEVEDRLADLASRGWVIREAGTAELPDGELTARFAFFHSLHQQVLAERPSPVQSARWHLRLGTWLEQSWGTSAHDHAARLALHFERGRAPLRAVRWLRESARIGAHRHAYPEALEALARALELAAGLSRTDRLEAERETFALRGLVHRSCGDFAAASEDFAAAAVRAGQASELAAQARALVLESSSAVIFDPARAERAFRAARDLAWEVGDPLLSTRVRALAGFAYLRIRGYRLPDHEAARRAVAASRQANERALLGEQLARCAYFDIVAGQHGAAEVAAAEASEIAAAAGDVYEFLVSQQYRQLALFHRGGWGELLHQLANAITVAERSGHAIWLDVFRFQEGWLRAAAFDCDRAVALCESSAACARALNHTSGEALSIAVMGSAHLAADRKAEARSCFARLGELLPSVHSSALGVSLLLASAEGHLAAGETAAAAEAARLAEARAAASGDRAHLALARVHVAEALASERSLDAAASSLDEAIAVLPESGALPIAWRVHAAAARMAERRRRGALARRHWASAADAIRVLAASLDSGPAGAALAASFQKAPPVAAALASAEDRPTAS